MITFERAIIGLMGLCTISLVAVAMNAPSGSVLQSPKANFTSIEADLDTASGAVASLRSYKNGNIKQLTVGSLSETFLTLDYDLATVRDEGASVPRVFVVNMPQDMPPPPPSLVAFTSL